MVYSEALQYYKEQVEPEIDRLMNQKRCMVPDERGMLYSGVVGVVWDRNIKCWKVQKSLNRKCIHPKYFPCDESDEQDVLRACTEAERHLNKVVLPEHKRRVTIAQRDRGIN